VGLVLLAAIALSSVAVAQESKRMKGIVAQIRRAEIDSNSIMAAPDKGIPRDLLNKALCVGIIPSEVKFAFLFGGSYGRGLLLCRKNGTIAGLTALVLCGSLLAGLVGSLTGLGGGLIITPLLTLLLGVDIHYAIGAALVSVIATSSGAAAAYVKEGFSNIRIGTFMEMFTTTGAVLGASLALHAPTSAIAVIFGLVLVFSAAMSSRSHDGGFAGQA
jgi:Sulfite exporter TauE/SafE